MVVTLGGIIRGLVTLEVKVAAVVGGEVVVIASVMVEGAEVVMHVKNSMHLTNCKLETATELVHQYFLSVEAHINADIPATCWLSTCWDCSNIYMWMSCACKSIPDIKIIE